MKNPLINLLALGVTGLALLGDEILYQTSFEPPLFTPGLPIRGQDNWQMFEDGEAISISTIHPLTGAQALRIDGGLIGQTGPNYGRTYCFSRALEDTANPAAIIEVRASVRLDGPRTGTRGLAGAALMAAVLSPASTSAEYLGGFLISSDGRIANFSAVSEDSQKYSVPYTFGTYRALAIRVDFIARKLTWFVDGLELGSGAIASPHTFPRTVFTAVIWRCSARSIPSTPPA